jgi:phosphate transport system permease protein
MPERETMTDDEAANRRLSADLRRGDVGPPTIGGESVLPPESPVLVGSAQPLAIATMDDSPPVFGAGTTSGGGKGRIGDKVFRGMAGGASGFIIVLVALIAVFLVVKAWPALSEDKSNFLFSRDWSTDTGTLRFGIVDLLWATVVVSLIAMILAFPISIGIALFITQYAPRRLAKGVAYVVDLLAAIPSIIYGIWGITVLAPKLKPVQEALYHIDFIPIFKNERFATGTIFDGGIVLAVMILPIMTAISRDVFARTPRHNIEAAWALGATRWEMIRLAVLPYGRPGVISGAMLGLGRALGETIAITLILSKPATGAPFTSSIFNGGETFASKIANNAAEFEDAKSAGAYIAAGLVLFVLTFLVNAAARAVVNRRKDFV